MKSLQIISLGLGVQSTTMYYMSSLGILPRADYAIFADTGAEKSGTMRYLKLLLRWQKENNGIPIMVIREKNLFQDILNCKNSSGNSFSSIPAYTLNADGTSGMLRRQCTLEYKIRQVDHAIRELYGLKPRERNIKTTIWKGITVDEAARARIPTNEKWKIFYYPFLNLISEHDRQYFIKSPIEKMYRSHCITWLKEKGYPVPPKSSCFICPYMSDAGWLDMKKNEPSDWKKAVKVDSKIRNSTKKGSQSPIYLHKSCLPLDQVILDENQLDFWGECSGNCHL